MYYVLSLEPKETYHVLCHVGYKMQQFFYYFEGDILHHSYQPQMKGKGKEARKVKWV